MAHRRKVLSEYFEKKVVPHPEASFIAEGWKSSRMNWSCVSAGLKEQHFRQL
jgi:hypothetical protein